MGEGILTMFPNPSTIALGLQLLGLREPVDGRSGYYPLVFALTSSTANLHTIDGFPRTLNLPFPESLHAVFTLERDQSSRAVRSIPLGEGERRPTDGCVERNWGI